MSYDLPALCTQVRRDILEMTHAAGSGHPGGSLSAVEILVSLYFDQMKLDPAKPQWADRDRMILSKGHAAPVLYSVLARRGFFDPALLPTLRQMGSPLQGHPHMEKLAGLDCSSGSLGQGLSVANGLALGGMTPYVSTYGVFLSGRAFDQIRTTVCYNNLKVRFGGAHAGISVGPDGATHQALEDIALARVLPRMTVVAPCDSEEVRKAVLAAADVDGPVYFRFGREATPVITDENTPFTLGKARLVREGTACAVFACGAMVYEALVAAEELAQEGIELLVYDLHTIKPLDEEAVINAAKTCGAVVTAEEHQLAGGLFGAVSETLVQHSPVPMEAVAVRDTFGESGAPEALMDAYGLNAKAIVQAVRRVLARKG